MERDPPNREEPWPFPPLVPEAAWRRIAAAHGLTAREAEIAAILCRGGGYAATQQCFRISRPTLRSHLRSLYRKLGCRNRVQLILRVVHEYRDRQ